MAEELRWEDEMLQELARSVAYPATPDMRGAVLSRLPEGQARDTTPRMRLALAAVAALALAAVLAIALSSDAREGVAGFLGLAVEGERIEVLPTPEGGLAPTPFPTPAGGTVAIENVAREVTRTEVEAAGTHLVLPASLGEPRGYYSVIGAPPVFIVDYGAIQIWEFPYAEDYFIGKGIVGGGAVVQELMVDGHKAYWVSGGSRLFSVNNAAGTPIAGTQRVVSANALLWSADGLFRRIEGATTLEEALRLAGEMP